MTYAYRERSTESWKKAQTAFKGGFESFVIEKFSSRLWRPRDNHNIFRILPPAESWMEYGHYGVRVYRHTNIGPKGASFLCHNLNDQLDALHVPGREAGKCPICKANDNARKAGTDEGKKLSLALYARGATVTWILDRNEMAKGPQLFIMPAKKVDQVICSLAFDTKRGKVRPVDHPNAGYDIEFDWVRQGDFPQYDALKLDTEPTPIVENNPALMEKILGLITENPIPSILKYHTIAHINEAIIGLDVGEDEAPGTAPVTGGGPAGEEHYEGGDWSGDAGAGTGTAGAGAARAQAATAVPAAGSDKPLDDWS